MNNIELSKPLLHAVDRLVDEKTGIITRLMEVPLQQCESDLFIFASECSDVNYARELKFSTGKNNILSSGSSFNKEEALWAVIGESCERYVASIYSTDNAIYSSQNSLENTAISLNEFVAFSDEQYARPGFRYCKPDNDKEIYWAEGFDLKDKSIAHVPAQLVWLGFPSKSKEEDLFPQVSTGLAAGADYHQAIYGGIREVIERDAFCCHWLLKHTPKKVKLEYILAKNSNLASLIAETEIEVHLLWMTIDIDVPCIMCILKPKNQSGIAIGMSCHLDPYTAAEKAIVEAFTTFNWLLEMKRNHLSPIEKEDILDFEHHVRYYLDKNKAHQLDFLLSGEFLPKEDFESYQTTFTENKNQIEEILIRVSKQEYKSYVVDVSQPNFAELNIFTVKVIIPGLQPLNVGGGSESHDDRRLSKAAKFWSIEYPNTLNSDPHPFP